MNSDHLAILRNGVPAWNEWRRQARGVVPDLTGARLCGADLHAINLRQAALCGADLSGANLADANLYRANLFRARLSGCRLERAGLARTILSEADLSDAFMADVDVLEADLRRACLARACLCRADLRGAALLEADLTDAEFTGARVYGVSAWRVRTSGLVQRDLVITPPGATPVTVDDLEVAQFIYLLLEHSRIRQVIDTVTSRVVLLLGRFDAVGRRHLDMLREGLASKGLCVVICDATAPASRDVTGTIELLARLARFVVADVSEPRSVPHELATVVPFLRQTPVIPVRRLGSESYSMLDDLVRAYPWVAEPIEYGGAYPLERLPDDVASRAEVIRRALPSTPP